MKKIILYICIALVMYEGNTQIAYYNQFPTLNLHHVLDDKLDNISFAFSMRLVHSDYTGPLVRLRRVSDNAEQDFCAGQNDIVDIDLINTWRGGANVFVVTWYDQSGLGRNATQTDTNRQPRFFPDVTIPHFQGDGTNDFLIIGTSIQVLTNNGVNGTVLGVMRATTKSQHSFGVLTNRDRWSTHINWSDNRMYFDPGICCNSSRSIANGARVNVWDHYSFMKTDTNVIIRVKGVELLNGAHTTGRCTVNTNFSICWANGNGVNNFSTTSFSELIMYNTHISATFYEGIEDNAVEFWGL